jgi:hypothetical protein
VFLLALSAAAAHAQDGGVLPEPAHVSYLDGSATLERDGDSEILVPNVPIVPGDRVSTGAGRLEILFPDGSALDVDQYTSIDLLSPSLIRLAAGRTIVAIAGGGGRVAATGYRVDTPAASINLDGPGEYRIAVLAAGSTDQTELAVLRGSASVTTDHGSMALRAGERSLAATDGPPSPPQGFNSARFDAFDRWYADRRMARVNPPSTQSAQYLPSDLRPYSGTLENNGSWQYDAPYGYVWYPNVGADWQPYYDGYWSSVPAYGWTWIGVGAWSWPTHHYGRWGYARGSWFWIPGRAWSTAWVSWAAAPGYASWCPLGFDGRPIVATSPGFRTAHSGWVVVPRSSFSARSFSVTSHSVPAANLSRTTTFVGQPSSPSPVARVAHTNAAVPLGSAVMRTPSASYNGGRPPQAVPSRTGQLNVTSTINGSTPVTQNAPAQIVRPTAPAPVRAPSIGVPARPDQTPPQAAPRPGPDVPRYRSGPSGPPESPDRTRRGQYGTGSAGTSESPQSAPGSVTAVRVAPPAAAASGNGESKAVRRDQAARPATPPPPASQNSQATQSSQGSQTSQGSLGSRASQGSAGDRRR